MTKLIAAIRLRGTVKTNREQSDALSMLNLKRANHCAVLKDDSTTRGALEKIKDFITYGEISDASIEYMVKKRGRKEGNKRIGEKEAKTIVADFKKNSSFKRLGIKPYFRLSPPSGGLRSVKAPFPKGDLGYRGENINKLLEKMI